MKHVKVGLTFALILAVLIVAFFASVYLANKTKEKEILNSRSTEAQVGNIYTNNEFGFSLDLPDEWADYKVEQTEGDIMFYFPTTSGYIDPVSNKVAKYGALFNIMAIPLDEAKDQDNKCAKPDPDRYWGECIGVRNKLGEDYFYRFAW